MEKEHPKAELVFVDIYGCHGILIKVRGIVVFY